MSVEHPESPVRLYVEHPDGFEGTGFDGRHLLPLIRNARFLGRLELPPVDQHEEPDSGDTAESTSG